MKYLTQQNAQSHLLSFPFIFFQDGLFFGAGLQVFSLLLASAILPLFVFSQFLFFLSLLLLQLKTRDMEKSNQDEKGGV
jgi:hypothetical protein